MTNQNRDYILHVRLTDAERVCLQELAEQVGQSQSDLTRQALAALITKPKMGEQEQRQEVGQ